MKKTAYVLILILSSIMLTQSGNVAGIKYEGEGVASTCWQIHNAKENEIQTTLAITNLSSFSNETLLQKMIKWEIYDYNKTYMEIWNVSEIKIQRSKSMLTELLYNLTVWIEQNIKFNFDLKLYMLLNFQIKLPFLPTESFASVILLNSLVILPIILISLPIILRKIRKKEV